MTTNDPTALLSPREVTIFLTRGILPHEPAAFAPEEGDCVRWSGCNPEPRLCPCVRGRDLLFEESSAPPKVRGEAVAPSQLPPLRLAA